MSNGLPSQLYSREYYRTLIGILGHNPIILFIMKPLPDVIVCECKDEKLREPLPEGDNSGNSG